MAQVHRFPLVLLAVSAVVLLFTAVLVVDRLRDRRAVRREVDGIVADAQAAYMRERNAALLDEYASEYPMRQRPSASAAEPGEPWQSRGDADDFPAGLVERADLTDTLDGENR